MTASWTWDDTAPELVVTPTADEPTVAYAAVIGRAVGQAFRRANGSRERSQQTAVGMSDVGGCRRQAAWQHVGVEPDPEHDEGEARAAMLGTWLHEALLPVLAAELSELLELEVGVEQGVDLEGLPGHLDVFAGPLVIDLKTKGSLASVRLKGSATERQWWQVELYAEARRRAGHVVTHVAVLFLDRAFGEVELYVRESLPDVAAEALAWWADARDAERDPDGLPIVDRDGHRGPDLDRECEWCPYARRCWQGWDVGKPQSVLIVEGATSVEAAAELYLEGAELEKRGKADKAFASAVLSATAPGVYGPYKVRRQRTGQRLDQRAARAALEASGQPVPLGADGWSTRVEVAGS